MYNLTQEDKVVLATLKTSRKYPRGRRSAEGIAEQTGLAKEMVEAVLNSEHHKNYITRHEREQLLDSGAEVKAPLYSMDMHHFLVWRS